MKYIQSLQGEIHLLVSYSSASEELAFFFLHFRQSQLFPNTFDSCWKLSSKGDMFLFALLKFLGFYMGFISLERQMFIAGLFRRVSVLMESQGLWHISTNRNGDREVRRIAKCFSS